MALWLSIEDLAVHASKDHSRAVLGSWLDRATVAFVGIKCCRRVLSPARGPNYLNLSPDLHSVGMVAVRGDIDLYMTMPV